MQPRTSAQFTEVRRPNTWVENGARARVHMAAQMCANGGIVARLRDSSGSTKYRDRSIAVVLLWRAQKLPENCSGSRDSAQIQRSLAALRPLCANVLPIVCSTEIGRCWPTVGQLCQTTMAIFDKHWLIMTKPGPNWPNLWGQIWPTLGTAARKPFGDHAIFVNCRKFGAAHLALKGQHL